MRTAAFVITLERAIHRKPQVEKILADCPLPATAVPAVDGAHLSAAEVARYYRRNLHDPPYHSKMRSGEVGCFLSHRRLWEHIVRERIDLALIVEDDVALDVPRFHTAYAYAAANIRPGDYLKFTLRPPSAEHVVLCRDGERAIVQPAIAPLGTVAQLVTRDAAARLLHVTAAFDRPVDTFLQLTWVTQVPITVISPVCIRDASAQVGGSTIAAGKSLLTRLQNEFHRPLYRARLARLARRHHKRAA